jgi:preprotein translocase subunit YajC
VQDLARLLPFVLIALVFYFLIMRPQRRRQQSLAATQSSLLPGAEVMLTSGIFGRVASLEDETLHLELSPGTVIKVARQAVVRVVDEDPTAPGADRLVDPEEDRGPTDPHQ